MGTAGRPSQANADRFAGKNASYREAGALLRCISEQEGQRELEER